MLIACVIINKKVNKTPNSIQEETSETHCERDRPLSLSMKWTWSMFSKQRLTVHQRMSHNRGKSTLRLIKVSTIVTLTLGNMDCIIISTNSW